MKQMKVKIQGVELEAALLSPKVMRQFNDGLKQVANKAYASKDLVDSASAIEAQCKAVIDFVDDVFGAGSARKVFGDETDLLTCLDAFEEMTQLYEKQVNPILKEYSDRAMLRLEGK